MCLISLGVLISPARADHDESKSVVVGNKLYVGTSYWNSSTSQSENQVWEYDGTNNPTSIKDFGSSSVYGVYSLGSKVVVFVYESSSYYLYVYDPSNSSWGSGVNLGNSWPSYVTEFNSKLYFSRYSSDSYYISSFDGSTVTKEKNFGRSYPSYLTLFNSKLYFVAGSGSTYTFYSYDGTTFTSETTLSSSVSKMVKYNSKLYMVLYSYSSGTSSYSIYSYDGTTLTKVASLGSNYPNGLIEVGSKLYYSAYNSSSSNYTLYSFDGSTSSTAATLSQYPYNMTAYKGRLIFSVWDNANTEYVLKEYDGTDVNNLASAASPPSKAADLVTTDTGTWLNTFKVMNGVLYFIKGSNSIWKYEIQSIAFSNGYPFASNISETTLDLFVSTNIDGTAYYAILPDESSAPTSAQVKAGTDAGGSSSNVIASGYTTVSSSSSTISITGLTTATSYDIWFAAEDNYSNIQSTPDSLNIATSASKVGTFASGYPTVTVGNTGTTATFTMIGSYGGKVYYVVLADGAPTPSANDVKNGSGYAGGSTVTSGNSSFSEDTETSLSISGLTASLEYDLYTVLGVLNTSGQETLQSNATRVDMSTDVTAPDFATDYPKVLGETQTSVTLKVKADEAGTAFYVVLADNATRPDSLQIKNRQDASGTTTNVIKSGSFSLRADTENSETINDLTAGTSYDAWFMLEDESLNANMSITKMADITTLALPKKLTVKKDGTGDHITISDAINAASSGTADTIVVYDGTYTENINFGGKNLVLKSNSGPANTIITPSNNGLAIVWFYNGEPSTAKLVGFTLTGGGDLQGSAINIDPSTGGTTSNPTIENCIITASKGYPIRFYNSSTVIKNTVLHNNTGDGVFYFDTYTTTIYPEIINCTVVNNTGYGIRNAKTYRPNLTNSIVWGNSSGGAFGNLSISYSIVQGSYTGTGNKSDDPLFMSSTDFDITNYSPAIGAGTASGAPTTDLADSTRGSPPDIGAYENSRTTPLTDMEAPTVSHVREGTTGNIEWVGSNSQLSAHWNGSDSGSGIKKYEYALDTSATTITGSIVMWTSMGTDTSVTITDLSLVEGKTYYLSVRATDMLNNVSNVVTSDGVKLDITDPATGSVVVGTDAHLHWANDTTSVTATWSGFSDGGSGIKEYEVMLRDSTSTADEVGWTVVSDAVTHIFAGLDLDNNSEYYIKVRATDKVGNISSMVNSALFQVDSEKPTVTTVFETVEGVNENLHWFGPDDEIIHHWKGSDNGSILQYHFAIGTAEETDDVIATTAVGLDTTDTTLASGYDEGVTYFTNIQVKDKAGNLSGIVSSDGFQIDDSPPNTGEVNDGEGEDLDFSPSTSSITISWDGFEDLESGIDHYRVSLGVEPGEDDIHSDMEVEGDQNLKTFTGLYLNHGETYYSSVVAVDLVGNESKIVTSDGFAVDEYPGPPEVSEVLPESGIYLSLISDGKLVFHFSEPVDYAGIEVTSVLGSDVQYELTEDEDSVVVQLEHPLMSLDTIEIILAELTDMSGRVAEDTLFTFYTELLADYNHDLLIDAADLSTLVGGWSSEDYAYELGPVIGEAPNFIPQPDNEYDLRDLMAYTRMWHWHHGTPQAQILNLARATVGEKVGISVDEKSLSVTVPETVVAGQVAFQLSGTETFLTMPKEKSGEMILLSHSEPALKQSLMDFAYPTGKGERHFVLPLELGRESSTVTLSYVLYGIDGEITGEGVKTIDVTPLPAEFVLDQNYPNPFNPTTRIEYGLPLNSTVNLKVYDLLGQEVRSLLSRDELSSGYHNIVWDARDNGGRTVSAGVYIYRLVARGEDGQRFSKTKKMVLLK
ncbi:MAG: T9SS type A sorting domain-containing protein [Candidatus Neomarinimicrobiota bacterium]|nr:T9SS type A sorting domain-containing protein [Candidatus Neomarinimicrobiota bacterium]